MVISAWLYTARCLSLINDLGRQQFSSCCHSEKHSIYQCRPSYPLSPSQVLACCLNWCSIVHLLTGTSLVFLFLCKFKARVSVIELAISLSLIFHRNVSLILANYVLHGHGDRGMILPTLVPKDSCARWHPCSNGYNWPVHNSTCNV